MKQMKQTEHPGVNNVLELWVTKAMADGIHINGEALRHKWTQFADMDGVSNDERLNLSEGWLTAFKKHCGLKEFTRHGEAGSASAKDMEKEHTHVHEVNCTAQIPIEGHLQHGQKQAFFCVSDSAARLS